VIHLCPEFLADLQSHGNSNFIKQVLSKCFSSDGKFCSNVDDHRYKGIEDAWIRYVSRGSSAFRAIYIKKGTNIYWYRVGEHSIEDHLPQPGNLDLSIKIEDAPATIQVKSEETTSHGNWDNWLGRTNFLKTTSRKYLRDELLHRRFIPHKEIFLVSPFISLNLLRPTTQFGLNLFKAIENGCDVTVITARPKRERADELSRIEQLGINILCLDNLHAKIYYYDVDFEKLPIQVKDAKSTVIIGSSNLTEAGLGLERGKRCNDELCVQLPDSYMEEAYEYIAGLATRAQLLARVRLECS
jgi:hypothetical protein